VIHSGKFLHPNLSQRGAIASAEEYKYANLTASVIQVETKSGINTNGKHLPNEIIR
jgi:hypothetical protein